MAIQNISQIIIKHGKHGKTGHAKHRIPICKQKPFLLRDFISVFQFG